MTIADDMRAASMGELARTKAQLKTANDEIEQLRRDLTLRTHGMFMAQEAAKDLARKLDKTQLENARLGLKLVEVLNSRESILCAARGMWKVLMHVIKDTPVSKSTVVQNVEQESYEALLRIVRIQQSGDRK